MAKAFLVSLDVIEKLMEKDEIKRKYNYVLLYNPYVTIKKQHAAKKILEKQYNTLFDRAQEVGANDLLVD